MYPQPHVLVVDDEKSVQLLVKHVLVDAGYRVTTTSKPGDAIELIGSGAQVDVLLTDLHMPGAMSGLELIGLARGLRPELPCLLMTAEPAHRLPSREGVDMHLLKPFPSLKVLELAVEQALAMRAMRRAAALNQLSASAAAL